MACNPVQQIFNSDRPEYTNTRTICTVEGYITEITASGLQPGDEIPILVGNPQSEEWFPYVINGQPVVLTYQNPTLIVDDGNCYQLDTSAVDDSTGVTVHRSGQESVIATTEKACLVDNATGTGIDVEIIRYENAETPVIYELGTNNRIVDLDNKHFVPYCRDREDLYPHIIRVTGENSYLANNIQSVTLTVLAGSVSVRPIHTPVENAVSVPMGLSMTWSVEKQRDNLVLPITFTGETLDSDFIVHRTSYSPSI